MDSFNSFRSGRFSSRWTLAKSSGRSADCSVGLLFVNLRGLSCRRASDGLPGVAAIAAGFPLLLKLLLPGQYDLQAAFRGCRRGWSTPNSSRNGVGQVLSFVHDGQNGGFPGRVVTRIKKPLI